MRRRLFLMLALAVCVHADELEPHVPKTRAPLDPKASVQDTVVDRAEADEIAGELGGILYMAQEKYSYERWGGKGISDCSSWNEGNGCAQCRLIMGHASADYYFYKDTTRSGCTLQQVDARFQVSDPSVLKRLKRTVQSMFGLSGSHGSKPASKEAGWDGSGPGWIWETGDDLAFLYMDQEQASSNGEGVARFQWRRVPLLGKHSS